MHFLNLPDVLTPFDNIVVEFIPQTQGCKLRPRESGKRMKIDAIYRKSNAVDDPKPSGNS
jgi:hypothetical protein